MKKIILLLLWLAIFASPVIAAPPFNPSMSEPPEYPGVKLKERLARVAPFGLMLAPTSYPSATVNVLFLRVDFPPDSDSQTEGTGEWSDGTYAYNNDADYWVDLAKTRFVDYWKEVSYGLLPINIEVSSKVYRLSYNMSHYGTETYSAIENLIYDSVTAATADIAFSNYDVVLIVHAGVGEETDIYGSTPDDIWSLYYGTGGSPICQNAGSHELPDHCAEKRHDN